MDGTGGKSCRAGVKHAALRTRKNRIVEAGRTSCLVHSGWGGRGKDADEKLE